MEQHSQTHSADSVEGAHVGLEWHAFLAFHNREVRLVGRVEAVDRDQIRLTRIDLVASSEQDADVCVAWDDVACIAVCGPDRDQDLFDLLHGEPDV
jgi:hypothetical protein